MNSFKKLGRAESVVSGGTSIPPGQLGPSGACAGDGPSPRQQSPIRHSQPHDLLIVMGDLNAKVGEGNDGYENIMGKHGLGERNENGEKLVAFCGLNNLVITGTIFPHRQIHKQTWVSPGGRTKNQIDHVLVSRQHKTSIMDTRVMRGGDIASDHQLGPSTHQN